MFSRKYQWHLVLAAGLVLGGAAPAHAADEAQSALIVAHGTGEVRVRPDAVRVDLGVEARATTLEEARRQVNGSMQHVLDAIHRLELPDLVVETRQISFNPVYDTQRDGTLPAIIGFSAGNHVQVTARSIPEADLADRAARVVDAALSAGANSVGGVDFFLADSSHAEDEALTLAVQHAESDAQTMAQAAHVTIVGPTWIEESFTSSPPRSLAMAAALVSTPIEVGDLVIQSNVTAKFAFR
jgi:uncharacterized protein YggE